MICYICGVFSDEICQCLFESSVCFDPKSICFDEDSTCFDKEPCFENIEFEDDVIDCPHRLNQFNHQMKIFESDMDHFGNDMVIHEYEIKNDTDHNNTETDSNIVSTYMTRIEESQMSDTNDRMSDSESDENYIPLYTVVDVYRYQYGDPRNPQQFHHRIYGDPRNPQRHRILNLYRNNGTYWIDNVLYCMIKESYVTKLKGECEKGEFIEFIKKVDQYPSLFLPFTRQCVEIVRNMFPKVKFYESLEDWLIKWCFSAEDLLLEKAWLEPNVVLPKIDVNVDMY
jgi:hypothetical protein